MIKKKEKDDIIKLYELYGFVRVKESENYMIFTYSNGYFYNAEVIKFEKDIGESEEEIRKRYEELGYSVRFIKYISYENTHDLLFNGFFAVDKISKRLMKEYEGFCILQSAKLLEADYEYVEPPCNWDKNSMQGNLIDNILRQINSAGAQLIILEAAAGYGKTCTSYEIIRKIAENNQQNYAPILTELSKNRKAALFRYVLLDEIDKKFTALSSELVISEIQNGKVPLVIDGFDELISRSNKNMSASTNVTEDDSQTMLDTIAELFKEGAHTKVVLTSRKSAIFTGDIFNEWVETHLSGCNVTRISIEEPTIQDWLGFEKVEYLEKHKIPFASVINPILLAFMRSMNMDTFREKCSNLESVIQYYFTSLLDRERERQALQLSVEEQYMLMKRIAGLFVEYDIMSEELSFIRDLFQEIIHEKYKEYRERYVVIEERPTEEEFATKLAGHALLNRVSPRKNDIGFINEFIFGIFIGDNIMENVAVLDNMDGKYIDIACTAYENRSEDKRTRLFEKVKPYIEKLNYEQQLDIEIKLSNTIKRNYYEHYFSNRSFNQDTFWDGEFRFENCTFRNCLFNKCVISTSAFKQCSFYDCKFYDVIVLRDTNENCRLIFSANCTGHEAFVREASYEEKTETLDDDYEKVILKKYWGDGNRFSKGKLPEIMLLKTQDEDERKGLEEALESLKKKELLFKYGHYWFLNKDKIKDIKEILGI